MVVRCKQHVALVVDEVVVERLNALEVEVVGGGVENETVGFAQLHAGNHHTHFLTAGQHRCFLIAILL